MIPGALADALIPEADGMPSATQVQANTHWLQRVLTAQPDLENQIGRLIASLEGLEPRTAIAELERKRPMDFEILFTALAAAYFMSEEVRERLRYPGQRALELTAAQGNVGSDPDSHLLTPVLRRGPIYRGVP